MKKSKKTRVIGVGPVVARQVLLSGMPRALGVRVVSITKKKVVAQMRVKPMHINRTGRVNGGALMAFRIRGKNGSSLWAGGTLRRANGTTLTFGPGEVTFTPRREWRSGRTGTTYPLSWTVQAGELALAVEPLFDDQEHDTRASTGTIYWEGAVRATRDGKPAGLGYLELTGYWRRPNL